MRTNTMTEAAGNGGLCLVSRHDGPAPHLTSRSALLHVHAHEDDDAVDLARLQPPRYFEPAPNAASLPDAYALEERSPPRTRLAPRAWHRGGAADDAA